MIVITLTILGLCLGSFVNALVWRLARQNSKEFSEGKRQTTIKSDNKYSITRGRSMCVHCKHELAAKDLVPVLSWVELRGKCRYCGKRIDDSPLVELAMPALFIASYIYWPFSFTDWGWLQFGFWLAAITILVALFVYDLRWMILPNKLVYPLIAIAVVYAALNIATTPIQDVFIGSISAVLCLAGLFYLLFQLSGGKWIGGGDVKLAVALGLLTGSAINALLLLFLASLGGSLLAIPLLLSGKAKRSTKVPFGPFLIAATYIVVVFGATITEWYGRVFLGL